MSITTERAALWAQGLEVVSREQWGARCSYTSPRSVITPARYLFLHIGVIARSGDPAVDMRTIERIGQSRFGIGCSYNASATRDGRLWEMQPLGRRGAHTVNDLVNPNFPVGSLNYLARALVLPQMVEDEVTDQQIDAAARWGAALCRSGLAVERAPWFGHRDVTRKACPGDKAYRRLDELNRLTRHYEINGLEDRPLMALTDQEQERLLRRVDAIYERMATPDVLDGKPAIERSVVERRVSAIYLALPELADSDVDETEVARLVLSGLDPGTIAAAVPNDFARQVVDELVKRLGS